MGYTAFDRAYLDYVKMGEIKQENCEEEIRGTKRRRQVEDEEDEQLRPTGKRARSDGTGEHEENNEEKDSEEDDDQEDDYDDDEFM